MLDDVFDFYRKTFLPAYADLVGYIGDKPSQIIIELENVLAHVAQYYNPDLQTKEKEENIKKAHDHIARATLDCYKLLWVEMNKDLQMIKNDSKRAFIMNIPEAKFDLEYMEFKRKAQIARSIELANVGIEPLGSINLYMEVITIGKTLISYIDVDKIQKFSSFKQYIKTKEFIVTFSVSFVLGIITGYIANYFWSLYGIN